MTDEPLITADSRWTRERANGDWGWVQRPCYRFTYPDGKVCWADMLDPEQRAMMERQALAALGMESAA